ncbi:MAG: O-antigen ligase family protein [Desulforegulaceae bacterium]|nr:O-antigen ligase family protein [Desulforegulaceae bacterium]
MPLKTILYIFILLSSLVLSIASGPIFGAYGYILFYNVNPLSYWWSSYIPSFLSRYAFLLSISIFMGFLIHFSKLRFNKWFESQEIIFFMFVLTILLSDIIGLNLPSDSNSTKMLKVFFVIFLVSHIVTDFKYYNTMTWIYVFSAFYCAFEISVYGSFRYFDGRLHAGRGGSDFSEGNFLAAHFLMIAPWVAVKFLKGNIKEKVLCFGGAALIANTLVLIRSRGSFLAIAVGCFFSIIISQKKYRKKIIILLIVGLIGFISVTDDKFWKRMDTIETRTEEMGSSSAGRVNAWIAAVEMFRDYPFGIGEGKFKFLIGSYNPEMEGRDTHNTFFRCLAELGVQGFVLLILLTLNAFRVLSSVSKRIEDNEVLQEKYALEVFALRLSLVMFLVTTIFLTHTYIEEFYWLLLFPVFLKRCLDNSIMDLANEK